MKHNLPAYTTYNEATADLDNLEIGTVVSVDETLRLYRVEDGVEKSLVPITNGANFRLVGNTLVITY